MPGWPSPFPTTSSARSSPSARRIATAFVRSRTCAAVGWRRSAATLAYDMLVAAETEDGVVPVTYEDDVHPYTRSGARSRGCGACSTQSWPSAASIATRGWSTSPTTLGVGHYVGILAPAQTRAARSDGRHPACRDARRPARGDLQALGHLERGSAAPLRAVARRTRCNSPGPAPRDRGTPGSRAAWAATAALSAGALRAAVITLVLSCLSMVLAVASAC